MITAIQVLAGHCHADGTGGAHCYGSNLPIGLIGVGLLVVVGLLFLREIFKG